MEVAFVYCRELIDCHTHTCYSGHGEGYVAEIAQAAVHAGISTLALTEHLPVEPGIDPNYSFSMSKQECLSYKEEVEAARIAFPQLDIIYGGEADWFGDNESYLLDVTSGYEYVLGSVHMIDGWEFDHPAQIRAWDEHDVDTVWRRYFEIWCAAVNSAVPFSCMAHPDLPKKFGHRPSFDTAEFYADIAQTVARRGMMIEVNSSGLRRPVSEVYPGPDLLKAFYDAGVDCTIGSDAHRPEDVGQGLQEALYAMKQAGYSRLSVPTSTGDRRYIPIEGELR